MTNSDPLPHPPNAVDRRRFIASATATTIGSLVATQAMADPTSSDLVNGSRQAMGTKVGEVSETSAIVWARLTAGPTRNMTGKIIKGKVKKNVPLPMIKAVDKLSGACPGTAGRIRLRYGLEPDLKSASATEWAEVSAATDYAHQFELCDLDPATVYHYATETSDASGRFIHAPFSGRFETAPPADQPTDLTFCVITCLMYAEMDPGDEAGFKIFPLMQRLSPKFVAFTGDNVYYDGDAPKAVTPELARYHWQRMYSLPRHIELLRNFATYWQKDDHDVQTNDCWPGHELSGELSFAAGQRIFRQQVPLVGPGYRTFRWGKWLQIWLTEGRDYRSPNMLPDGPEKTIWGQEQKAWLKHTLAQSDARWKVLITPTPIVGPDRSKKNDNHANAGFAHEGDDFRRWVRENCPDNFFAVGGDRHWQYHSVHPETGVHEFGCGPPSDRHAAGSPGKDETYHRYHAVRGGFLSVAIEDGQIAFRHHTVRGDVVYEYRPQSA